MIVKFFATFRNLFLCQWISLIYWKKSTDHQILEILLTITTSLKNVISEVKISSYLKLCFALDFLVVFIFIFYSSKSIDFYFNNWVTGYLFLIWKSVNVIQGLQSYIFSEKSMPLFPLLYKLLDSILTNSIIFNRSLLFIKVYCYPSILDTKK